MPSRIITIKFLLLLLSTFISSQTIALPGNLFFKE